MTNEINKDNMDLATFIDADQQPERQKIFSGQQLDEVVVEETSTFADGPKLLSENRDRIANRRGQERFQKVEPGKLFHGWIRGYELTKASNGMPYLKFDCQLECNEWHLTHTKFLPRNKINSTEEIAAARDEILAKYGFDADSKKFPAVKIFEIGFWDSSDGKRHNKVERVYADTKDYNSYQQWKWNRDHAPKKQWQAPNVELPE